MKWEVKTFERNEERSDASGKWTQVNGSEQLKFVAKPIYTAFTHVTNHVRLIASTKMLLDWAK